MKRIHLLQLIHNRGCKKYYLFTENAKKGLRVAKFLKIYSFLNKYFASICESYDFRLVHWVYYFFHEKVYN